MNSSLAVAALGSQQRGSLWAGSALAGVLEEVETERQVLYDRQDESTQL